MIEITFKREACPWLIKEVTENGYTKSFWVEVERYPIIGEKYQVVFYCDYDNSEYGENYVVEVTEENIDEIAFAMNDPNNDITEYILIEQ